VTYELPRLGHRINLRFHDLDNADASYFDALFYRLLTTLVPGEGCDSGSISIAYIIDWAENGCEKGFA
jgi:hypothetical protein